MLFCLFQEIENNLQSRSVVACSLFLLLLYSLGCTHKNLTTYQQDVFALLVPSC
jgi:hypothetical protein